MAAALTLSLLLLLLLGSQDIAYTPRIYCILCPVLIASIENQFEHINVGHGCVRVCVSVCESANYFKFHNTETCE